MKKVYNKVRSDGIVLTTIFIILSCVMKLLRKIILLGIPSTSKRSTNLIMFESVPDMSDNARILFEYLSKNRPQYKFVWVVEDVEKFKTFSSSRVRFVPVKSRWYSGIPIKAFILALKSKYIFYTHLPPLEGVSRRHEQIVVNLWHGCGYKASGRASNENVGAPFDYVLVPGEIFVDTKQKFFGCRRDQILPIGYPRYDLMMTDNKRAQYFIKALKGMCDKLILWMPTFRKTGNGQYPEEKIKREFDLPVLESLDDMRRLDKTCSASGIMLCIKRHPFQTKYNEEKVQFKNIKFIDDDDFVKANVQLYSIFRYTNALISDYSSVAVDYLLVNKPIGFILDDFNQYQNSRGFAFDNPLDYMPGSHIFNFNQLCKFISEISEQKDLYADNREKLLPLMHCQTSNYCKKITEIVGV